MPGESSLAFLNHPLLSAGVAGLMLLVAVASPLCGNRAQRFWSRYASDARLGNRMFSFFGFMCHDHRTRAADLRMYNQQEQVCDVSMSRLEVFGARSRIARYARGPMGGLYALGEALSMGLTGLAYLFVCLKAWAGAFGVGEITQYVGALRTAVRPSFRWKVTGVKSMIFASLGKMCGFISPRPGRAAPCGGSCRKWSWAGSPQTPPPAGTCRGR